jgi:hypothetical protein
MEEIPILSAQERSDLIQELEQAETRIESGEFIEHDPASFTARLLAIYRATISKA